MQIRIYKQIYHMRSNYSQTKLSPGAIREFLGEGVVVTVKRDVEQTRTQCPAHCGICSIRGSKYNQRIVAYQLIIWLSWCEASNDVDLFLLYGQAARSALVGNGGFFHLWQAPDKSQGL